MPVRGIGGVPDNSHIGNKKGQKYKCLKGRYGLEHGGETKIIGQIKPIYIDSKNNYGIDGKSFLTGFESMGQLVRCFACLKYCYRNITQYI